MYTMLSITESSEYLVASVDCTHVGSAAASFEDLVTLHRRILQRIFWRISYGLLWAWYQLTRSENSSNQVAEPSMGHVLWYESSKPIVSWWYLPLFHVVVVLLHWIKKRSSCWHLLEHLESSGTKILVEDIVRQLCVGWCRETNKDLEDEFCSF